MAKDPAFLFYPGDYIAGTMHLTLEQKGAYIELLMLQFNVGHMTKHMIGHVLGQSMVTVWSHIQDKFKIDGDGKYYNERLELEKKKRIAYSQSRRNNVKGKNQHNKGEKKRGHMTPHMEDEDVNENIDSNKDVKKIVYPFDTPEFMDLWGKWKSYKREEHNFKYKSKISEQGALTKLAKLAHTDENAISIIMQSIENGWRGFFELKKEHNGKETNNDIAARAAANYIKRRGLLPADDG